MACDATDEIAADCDNIIVFLQVVALKSRQVQAAPRVQAALLSLRADKRATRSFRQWRDSKLKLQALPNKAAPQDHSGLTGFLIEVATHLQNAKSLCPVIAAQREADREKRGWYRLLSTSQRVILSASTANRLTILSAPPPSIHRFLNVRNSIALQADCAPTYSGTNIFLPTAF